MWDRRRPRVLWAGVRRFVPETMRHAEALADSVSTCLRCGYPYLGGRCYVPLRIVNGSAETARLPWMSEASTSIR